MSRRVDGLLVAVAATLKTPSGSPASFHSSAIHSAAVGTFSLGFSTTVLPAAMAIGKNHIGTMAGKLNGLMIPTTPSGWRTECTSTPVEAFSVIDALEQVRDAAGELHDLLAAADLAERVGEHLAVLGGDDRGELVLAGVQQLAEGEQHLRPLGQRGVPPRREGRLGAAATAVSTSASVASASCALTSPVAGLVTSEKRPLVPFEGRAVGPVGEASLPW